MTRVLSHLQRKFFQPNLIAKLFHRNFCRDLKSEEFYCKFNHKFKSNFYNFGLRSFNMDVSNSVPEMNVGDLKVQNEVKLGESQVKCTSNDQSLSMTSDIDSFDLNMLFDMEKVVKNVKIKLKEKREDKKMQRKVCNSSQLKNGSNKTKKSKTKETGKNSECVISNIDDSDSSFGLCTLFEQKTSRKRQRKSRKMSNKNVRVKKMKDESYGLEWLFGEKNIGDKKNKQKNKRRMIDYDISQSEEDELIEVKVKKKRPNHFLAIRVSDPTIHLAVKGFQDTVLKENEKLKPALIPLISLHITIAVMFLDETAIKIAQESLEKCKDKISEALKTVNFKLIFRGVGNFRNEVLFVKLQEKEHIECLKTIYNVLMVEFEENGISFSDKKEYNPHLTLFKLSRKSSLRKNGIKKVDESVYDEWLDSYFGEEVVKNLHLCSMLGAKEKDGFYGCLATIPFCDESDTPGKTNETNSEENTDLNQ